MKKPISNRSCAQVLVGMLVATVLAGAPVGGTASAASSTDLTWNITSLTAGEVVALSDVATTNSSGVRTWSETGSCSLTPNSKPTKLTMGLSGSCKLTLKIGKSKGYSARTSTKKIALTSITTPTESPATTLAYNVGDIGPSGGVIFYKNLKRAAGSQYFEAACAGWSDGVCGGEDDLTDPKTSWGCPKKSIPAATKKAIGNGENSTAKIVASCATPGIAARLADDLVLGGNSDWFLPSKDELHQMYIQRKKIDGFNSVTYWSSTEEDRPYLAWYHSLIKMTDTLIPEYEFQRMDYKSQGHTAVRPVRSF